MSKPYTAALSRTALIAVAFVLLQTGAALGKFAVWDLPANGSICAVPQMGPWIMAAMNLSQPGLSSVAQYAKQGDYVKACEALAEYYANGSSGAWLRVPQPPVTQRRGEWKGSRACSVSPLETITCSLSRVPWSHSMCSCSSGRCCGSRTRGYF